MIKLIASIFVLIGALFTLGASIGLIRLPDLYTRMHAATKAGTLGIAFILVGTAIDFHTLPVFAQSMVLIGFIFASAPIAAHLLARSAYKNNEPMRNTSQTDELLDALKCPTTITTINKSGEE